MEYIMSIGRPPKSERCFIRMKKRLLCLLLALCLTISAMAFVGQPASAASTYDQAAIEQELNALISQYCGTVWPYSFNGAIQCKGFADMIYHELFGTGQPGPYTSNRYILSPLNQTVVLGTLHPGEVNAEAVATLFAQARAGDYVQMVRWTGTQHSAIVVSVSAEGVTFFDCNLKGSLLCACYFYTWENIATYLSKGVSLYRHAGYEPSDDFQIYFDANGGTCSLESKSIAVGQQYGALPTPVREGYRFDYWYLTEYGFDAEPTELRVSAATRHSTWSNAWLTAHWTSFESVCGQSGHQSPHLIETVAPTCESIGYTSYYCSLCEQTYEEDIIEALGHDYRLIGSIPATAVEDGSCSYHCDRCGNEYTEVILSTLGAFTDLDTESWYYPYVYDVVEEELMNGTSTETFSPDNAVTRAMLVTILYRMEGAPAAAGSDFSDVPASQWYADAVSWAAENGVVTGYPDGTFRPDAPITREQVAVILHRYAALCSFDNTQCAALDEYTDVLNISGYAINAMEWAAYHRILSGFPDLTLRPQGSATRAQVCKMLIAYQENAQVDCGVA